MGAKKLSYKKQDAFYSELQGRISGYCSYKDITKYANSAWYLKATILVSIYLLSFISLFVFGSNLMVMFSCYAIFGVLSIVIGLNIGHDAAHNTISKNKNVNKVFLWVFDVLGANSYMWKMRHVHAHHPYPNVIGYDTDIQQSKLVRIFPKDSFLSFHKFQHLYTPLLLISFYTLNWFLFRDFKDFKQKVFGNKVLKEHPEKEIRKLFLFKSIFLINMLLLPALFVQSIGWVILGFMLMNICSGFVISIALVSTHVGEHHEFPVPDDDGQMEYSWAQHQMATTSDFCTNNRLVNAAFGGFNHHVFHHLFPGINHIHYPKLTPILIETAEEFGVPYHAEQNLLKVFLSHIKLLKREGYSFWLETHEI